MFQKQNRKRGLLGGTLTLSLILTLIMLIMVTPFNINQPTAQAQTSAVTAKQADKFVDTIGVNIHLHYGNTAYGDFDGIIKPKLIESGIRHVRDGVYTYSGANRNTWYYQRLRQLGENGIKFQLQTSMLTNHSEFTNYDLLDDVYSWGDGAIIAFEGINEPNIQGVGDWINIVRREQAKLWNKVQGDATLKANVKVVGPSPIFGGSYQLGNMESNLDYSNGHFYPGGFCITCGDVYRQTVDSYLPEMRFPGGNKPIMITETGYNNAVNSGGGGNRPASELAAGKYTPRLFFEFFNRGFTRTFNYEFIDQFNNSGKNDAESNFGLLRNDGSEKPAFTAMKNVIGLLKDPGASFTPGSLNYTLSGNTSDVHQTLLQKRDGTFYLALWVDKSSYDNGMRQNEPNNNSEPARRKDLVVQPQAVTVSFGSPISAATIYSLSDAGNMSSAAATVSGNAINLNVPDKVTIIKLAAALGDDGDGDDTVPVGRTIALRAAVNNLYVTAENAGNGALVARRSAVGSWEQFVVVDAGNGEVALKSVVSGKYVMATNAGGGSLGTYARSIGLWERFRWIDLGGGQFALQAVVNNRYVCAENYGNSSLIANRSAVQSWETFTYQVQP